jgi:hypothetical protein
MEATTDVRVDPRRARFREAVTGLASRARSGDLLRMVLMPASVLLLVGFAFMLLGWWGAAHTHRQIEQIPYLISGGLIGFAMVVLGGLLLATAIWLGTLQQVQQRSDERAAAQLRHLVEAFQEQQEATRTPSTRSSRAPLKAKGTS